MATLKAKEIKALRAATGWMAEALKHLDAGDGEAAAVERAKLKLARQVIRRLDDERKAERAKAAAAPPPDLPDTWRPCGSCGGETEPWRHFDGEGQYWTVVCVKCNWSSRRALNAVDLRAPPQVPPPPPAGFTYCPACGGGRYDPRASRCGDVGCRNNY